MGKLRVLLGSAANLTAEIPTLKSEISQLHYLFSMVSSTSKPDAMTQIKLAAAQEIADKYGIRTEGDISSLEKRLKLLPNYISSIKDEISEEQLKLKRVSDLIAACEKIILGNYIDNLIRAQRDNNGDLAAPSDKSKLTLDIL